MTPPSLYTLLTLNRVENLMSNNTINIALIGYGFVGKTFHAPLIRSVPGLNLAFVASRDEEKVKRDLPDVTVIASPEAAVQHPDVDLVVIASPNATHAPLARLALNAGKHVVVDKPFTLDMQEARQLIALAQVKQLSGNQALMDSLSTINKTLKEEYDKMKTDLDVCRQLYQAQ